MKVIKIICFFGVSFLILSGLSCTLFKEEKGEIEKEPEGSIDYMVLGDSEAYSSVSPMFIYEKTGLRGYNLGVSAQNLQNAYHLFAKSIEQQQPKILLLETNMIYKQLASSNPLTNNSEDFIRQHLSVFKNHSKWQKIALKGNKEQKETEKVQAYISKGFKTRKDIRPYEKSPDYMKETSEKKAIPRENELYLQKIIDLCRKKGIKPIFYSVPSPVNWSQEKHNAVAEFAKKQEVEFLDFNVHPELLKIDWAKDTYDAGDHLNFFGAQKIGTYISKYLMNNIEPAPNIDEKIKTQWDTALKQFQSMQ